MTKQPYPQSRAALAAAAGELPVSDPRTDIAEERRKAVAFNLGQPREDVARVEDRDANGVPVRIYWPASAQEGSAVIVHLHGGGFVFNDVDVHDALSRRLANRSELVVVSVDYRRPPEHRFPAAPDDVDTAIEWVRGRAGQLGVDPDRVLLHGDSAGACLALVAALRHPGRFAALALVYPFIDATLSGRSWDDAPGNFNRDEGAWYWQQYANGPGDFTNPDFSPALAKDLTGLPPTLVITAEFDPCRDEGELLASRIAEAGVPVVAARALGLVHGFYRHFDAYDAAETTLRQVATFLDQHAR
jgi:acetyl esterase